MLELELSFKKIAQKDPLLWNVKLDLVNKINMHDLSKLFLCLL